MQSPAHPQDLALRQRLLAGDRAAALELEERHLQPLFEFVHYRVGGDRSLAEDLVQETMLEGVRMLERFDGRSSLSTWLFGIARNKLRERRRKRQPVLIEDALTDADDEIQAVLAQIDREPLPDWILEREETKELVGATLSSLPPDYGNALREKYLEGLSVREMAARRDAGEKATESMLHRARLAFASVFQLLTNKKGGVA